jgi:DNA mismatch repair protein MutL
VTLRLLPDTLVSRIAAGEVIERPAAAVKELVENALDAHATRVDVMLGEAGKAVIVVADDGWGMTRPELALAVERHATSKLPGDDLTNIATFGFRGEALPSIGAVARLAITSRAADSSEAWTIRVEGGARRAPEPAALAAGTRVEVRDLFYATPARLKFLKAVRTELDHAADIVNRLAMACPEIAFSLFDDARAVLRYAPSGDLLQDAAAVRLARLSQVMGRDFADNALPIDTLRESVRLSGYVGLPTLNRATSAQQYLFVNGRPVRDRLLQGAVRGAYQDFLARDRHPLVALFVDLPAEEVDVNVHPTKAEVRFRDPGLVRGLIVGASKHALAAAGHRASTTVSLAALGSFRIQRQHIMTTTALLCARLVPLIRQKVFHRLRKKGAEPAPFLPRRGEAIFREESRKKLLSEIARGLWIATTFANESVNREPVRLAKRLQRRLAGGGTALSRQDQSPAGGGKSRRACGVMR